MLERPILYPLDHSLYDFSDVSCSAQKDHGSRVTELVHALHQSISKEKPALASIGPARDLENPNPSERSGAQGLTLQMPLRRTPDQVPPPQACSQHGIPVLWGWLEAVAERTGSWAPTCPFSGLGDDNLSRASLQSPFHPTKTSSPNDLDPTPSILAPSAQRTSLTVAS